MSDCPEKFLCRTAALGGLFAGEGAGATFFHGLRVGRRTVRDCYEKFPSLPSAGRAAVPGRPGFRRALQARPSGYSPLIESALGAATHPVAQVFNLCLHRRDACATRLFMVLREPQAHERLS